MGVMCGEKGENFMILFWEKEREEEERRRREGEDRIKSAMGIKSFCHDIVFFGNGVFGRGNLLDMNKNMDRMDLSVGGFALKIVVEMPKI